MILPLPAAQEPVAPWSPILQNQGAAETSAPELFHTSAIYCCFDFLFTVTEISLSSGSFCNDKKPQPKPALGGKSLWFHIKRHPWRKSEEELEQGKNLEAGPDAGAMGEG